MQVYAETLGLKTLRRKCFWQAAWGPSLTTWNFESDLQQANPLMLEVWTITWGQWLNLCCGYVSGSAHFARCTNENAILFCHLMSICSKFLITYALDNHNMYVHVRDQCICSHCLARMSVCAFRNPCSCDLKQCFFANWRITLKDILWILTNVCIDFDNDPLHGDLCTYF